MIPIISTPKQGNSNPLLVLLKSRKRQNSIYAGTPLHRTTWCPQLHMWRKESPFTQPRVLGYNCIWLVLVIAFCNYDTLLSALSISGVTAILSQWKSSPYWYLATPGGINGACMKSRANAVPFAIWQISPPPLPSPSHVINDASTYYSSILWSPTTCINLHFPYLESQPCLGTYWPLVESMVPACVCLKSRTNAVPFAIREIVPPSPSPLPPMMHTFFTIVY